MEKITQMKVFMDTTNARKPMSMRMTVKPSREISSSIAVNASLALDTLEMF